MIDLIDHNQSDPNESKTTSNRIDGNNVCRKDFDRERSNHFRIEKDFYLTIFASALFSLKATSVLKPYPSDYFDQLNQEIQRDRLIETFNSITDSGDDSRSKNDALKLKEWILSQRTFRLKPIKFNEICSKARKIIEMNIDDKRRPLRPNFIFELENSTIRSRDVEFNKLRKDFDSFYAFHGSPMENFHSILHNGLLYCLNKRSLLGFGTYLSSKLEVAILFSPFSKNFYKDSCLGKKLSCVAVCEVIDHPDIETKKDSYYVVSNDRFLRVAYLLLYSSDLSTNYLHHLNVSSMPCGMPDAISTTTTSNIVFFLILFVIIIIGFFWSNKVPH
ncbi:Protein mono-ADP-ribosyltransferase PARP16 [Sarcoptes scabiei]|uniref:Mono [ADP-ribose] polymerase PARP16 n=1 Tax=Sarcoptes scabiei TaxID=52283 RepID=A0A834RGI7_SARSC|nr:Protein mono-ADP-ribosyltransferase PARP16 [Sarcoptes scabiei]